MKTTVVYAIQPDVIHRKHLREDQKKVQKEKLKAYADADKYGDQVLENPKDIVEHAKLSGCEGVVACMKAHMVSVEIQARACGALSELANYTLRKKYGRQRGIYASNEDTTKSQNNDPIIQMARDGAITAILNSLVKHRTEKRVAIKATWALKAILKCRENADFFISAGGLSVISSVALAFGNDKDVMKAIKDVRYVVSDPEGKGGIVEKIRRLCTIV